MSAPAMLVVTLIFLIAVLSIPVNQPQKLIWLAVYPIVASEMSGIGYGNIFLKSLWILPLAILIGIFNPIIDISKAFTVSGITISRGWVSFISIIFRALLSFQSLLLLIATSGFLDMFNAMRHIGCPAVLSTQLLLTYRYISVIIEEAIIMNRARQARGYGKKVISAVNVGKTCGAAPYKKHTKGLQHSQSHEGKRILRHFAYRK